MTNADDELLSGRDLRDAVALRVMGWTLADRRAMGWSPGPDVWLTGDVENPTEQDWWPTESIEAAFQVVQKMRERGLRFQLTDRFAVDHRLWWVEFATPDNEYGGQHFAATVPEAICFAALEAMRQLTERDAALACLEGSKG